MCSAAVLEVFKMGEWVCAVLSPLTREGIEAYPVYGLSSRHSLYTTARLGSRSLVVTSIKQHCRLCSAGDHKSML